MHYEFNSDILGVFLFDEVALSEFYTCENALDAIVENNGTCYFWIYFCLMLMFTPRLLSRQHGVNCVYGVLPKLLFRINRKLSKPLILFLCMVYVHFLCHFQRMFAKEKQISVHRCLLVNQRNFLVWLQTEDSKMMLFT